MSTSWDDFDDSAKVKLEPRRSGTGSIKQTKSSDDDKSTTCDWGFSRGQSRSDNSPTGGDCQSNVNIESKFVAIYESYLQDKKSLPKQTTNYKTYVKNAQKELRDWFENEGHDFKLNVCEDEIHEKFACSLDIPVEEHDFTFSSELHTRRKDAIDEVCLDACRLLDECQLLYTWRSNEESYEEERARKRQIDEANKEDDIVFDKTVKDFKRHCSKHQDEDEKSSKANSSLNSNVNTYDSLMAKWRELNMLILQSKAKLVKLDLSVTTKDITKGIVGSTKSQGLEMTGSTGDGNETGVAEDEDEDEIDPLDEFMSSLETKTKLSMDDKIEKSRLKTQIASYEREQNELSRLIEIAKPSFKLAS